MKSAFFPLLLLSSIAWSQPAGSFAPAAGLITPRFGHTATLLADGRVLIAGGNAGCSIGGPCLPADAAEIYDPATGAFTATGSMSPAARRVGGILLADGRVFFASSSRILQNLAAIELYDPLTGTFGIAGKTAALTDVTTATLLKDGRVLIAGFAGSFTVAGAEIYDPIAGSSTPVLNGLADAPSAAIGLADGRVLFQFYEDDARIYDPVSGSVSDAGGLCCFDGPPQASILLNGGALFSGGNDIGGSEISVELYDPALARFAPPIKMSIARDGHSSTLLPNGTVLLAGGLALANRSKPAVASAEIYDPATGSFSLTGSLAAGRADHAAVLLNDGRVLITGGATFSGSGLPALNPINGMSSAEIYTPMLLRAPAALLSISGDGKGPGAIQHAGTYRLVTPDDPAQAGEALVIYGTGLIDGGVIPPQVAIGGRAAEVLWFGSTPGYSALNQVNVRMPVGVAAGGAVPVRMNYLGRPSNVVTIAVNGQ